MIKTDKKKSISLKAYLWLYFCTFAVVIMLMLWVLQTLFLGTFYNSMKLNELKKAGRLISEQYDLNDENFYKFWFEHSFNSGIFAQLVTEDGVYVQNFNNVPETDKSENKPDRTSFAEVPGHRGEREPGNRAMQNRGFMNPGGTNKIVEKIKNDSDGKVAYIEEAQGDRASFGVYGEYLGEADGQKVYLYLISPLERTDTTRKVLETQLLIASGLSIVLALVIAYFIAIRFSKPIEKINRGAKRLALGDYRVEFEEGSYREIDELSNTLNYATNELSKTEELRRDLISNVSHDLRTPLTIIKSYAELIRDISGTNDEKRTKHTEIIIEEANNLSLLVNDMLDLSKIQSGTMAMEIVSFDFKALVSSTVKRFGYYTENHGVVFETDYDTEAFVSGDERRIEQVIYNLVANAVNYTGDDKRVMISLKDHNGKVRFSVRDTGCGISEEEIDLVWDRYYKASETHKREKIGTGIGLSIVKNILLAHNAGFGVESMVGKGSEFWFELERTGREVD